MTPSTKKKLGLFGAFMVGLTAVVLKVVPATSGGGVLYDQVTRWVNEAAQNIPDECPAGVCADAGRGAILPLDGGVRGICECP